MLFVLERAVQYYYEDRPMWQRLVRRGMEADFGWAASAKQYLALYTLLSGDAKKRGKKNRSSVE